jgi:RNA polymerase sigma factor (sigma-70 family)
MTAGETHQAIEAIFRIERARLIAGLARIVRNVDLAEELAQDALVIALSEWPRTGVPANPGAWLMTAAKRRAIDAIRRDRMRERKHEEIARELDGAFDGAAEVIEAAMDDDLGDELLGLIFTACHPILSPDARAALTLRVIGGLTTDEIARAFLSSEATIAQRIVRAKKTIGRPDSASRRRAALNARPGFPRCSRSSTSSSMKAMPPQRAMTLSGRVCAWRRSGWAACWRDSCPRTPKCSACWP